MASTTPFSTAGMNWRGMAPPTIWSTNSKPSPRSSGSTRRTATPNWPWPPVCFLYLPSASALLGDRLPVGDQHLLGLHLDAELALQPLGGDGQVGLAHAAEQGLVGLVVALDGERRVLLLQPVQGGHQLVLVALGLRAGWRRDSDRLGRRRPATTTGVPLGARVSPVAVSASLATATMSPAGASVTGSSCSLPRRAEQAVQPLVGVGAGVDEDVSSGRMVPDSTLNSEILPDVGVGDGLEHPGQRLAAGIAGDLALGVARPATSTGGRVGGGPDLADEGGQAVDADRRCAEPHTTGNTGRCGHPVGQGLLELLDARGLSPSR